VRMVSNLTGSVIGVLPGAPDVAGPG
jgi:hypothetical protein